MPNKWRQEHLDYAGTMPRLQELGALRDIYSAQRPAVATAAVRLLCHASDLVY